MLPEAHLLYRRINQSKWDLFEQGVISKADLQINRFADLFYEIGGKSINPDEFNSEYLDNLTDVAQLIDGAFEVCAELSKTKRLAVITNGIAKHQSSRIEKSTIKRFISGMFVSEDIGFSKPDTRHFDYVFEKLGLCDKSLVLVVGDSLTSDIQGGFNYGLDTCYFNPSKRATDYPVTPTYEIDTLIDME